VRKTSSRGRGIEQATDRASQFLDCGIPADRSIAQDVNKSLGVVHSELDRLGRGAPLEVLGKNVCEAIARLGARVARLWRERLSDRRLEPTGSGLIERERRRAEQDDDLHAGDRTGAPR
jgi:hypothetical protein